MGHTGREAGEDGSFVSSMNKGLGDPERERDTTFPLGRLRDGSWKRVLALGLEGRPGPFLPTGRAVPNGGRALTRGSGGACRRTLPSAPHPPGLPCGPRDSPKSAQGRFCREPPPSPKRPGCASDPTAENPTAGPWISLGSCV